MRPHIRRRRRAASGRARRASARARAGPVEVRRPGHQPLLEPLLHRRDCLGELDARAFGLAFDRVAPLLGEAPFLLAELVTGVRALAGEHPLELENSLLRLLLREG
jgi:hypothetical protein